MTYDQALRLTALTVIVMTACSDDGPTDTGARGRAEAVIRDDPSRLNAATSGGGDSGGSAPFTGSMTTNANVAISADGQTWTDLGSPNGITVKIQTVTVTRFVFELNSEAWVTATNLQSRVVADAEVQQSTTVASRTGS